MGRDIALPNFGKLAKKSKEAKQAWKARYASQELMAPGGRYVKQTWPGNPAGQGRAERMPGRFDAYVPDPISAYEPRLTGALARLLSDSDASVRALNRLDADRATQIEALARQLLRQESLASSRIEGLVISHKRISEAGYDPRGTADQRAREVLANIEAMEQAIRIGAEHREITLESILDLHRTLLGATQPKLAGVIRDSQNWIGGRYHTPIGADFIPPPATEVPSLLHDLAEFMNRDDLPATFQAAVAHAQFETIHPFADGNGRTGRCLIHVILRRAGVAVHHVPPVSLLMATDVESYVKALTAYREGVETDWIEYFAETTVSASAAAEDLAARLTQLQSEWKARAGVRRGSSAEKIIDLLPLQPVIDVKKAAELTGVSEEAARQALNLLEDRGVLEQATKRNWGRVWEAKGLWNLLDRFEERLATPQSGVRPARPVPQTR